VKFFQDETSEALAMRAGGIDVVASVDDPRAFLGTAPSATILKAPSCYGGAFSMNTQSPPWNDVHVRRAVAYALKRADIIAAVGGYAVPLHTFISPAMLRSSASSSQVKALLKRIPQYPFSLEKAKQEMARSAYPTGFTTPLTTIQGLSTATQVIAAELRAIGINAQIQILDVASYANKVYLGEPKDRPTILTGLACDGASIAGYDWLVDSMGGQALDYNPAAYASPAVERLLSAGRAEINPTKRFAYYSKALARIQSDVPYVPLYLSQATLAHSSRFAWRGRFGAFGIYPWSGTWPLHLVAKR
jgi:peptide/nickel transport system substrate-binding protein